MCVRLTSRQPSAITTPLRIYICKWKTHAYLIPYHVVPAVTKTIIGRVTVDSIVSSVIFVDATTTRLFLGNGWGVGGQRFLVYDSAFPIFMKDRWVRPINARGRRRICLNEKEIPKFWLAGTNIRARFICVHAIRIRRADQGVRWNSSDYCSRIRGKLSRKSAFSNTEYNSPRRFVVAPFVRRSPYPATT